MCVGVPVFEQRSACAGDVMPGAGGAGRGCESGKQLVLKVYGKD